MVEIGRVKKGDPCPTAQGGRRVTILSWRMYSAGPGLNMPVVHVRFARSARIGLDELSISGSASRRSHCDYG